MLSGRFTVHKGDAIGPVAEIAQGELVGEVGFFAGLPRTATVLAARDSIVLEISRNHFEKAAEALPSLREAVTTFLARRFATQSSSCVRLGNPAKIRTLAIVAAGGSQISPVFIEHLQRALSAVARARFVSRHDIHGRFARSSDRRPADPQLVERTGGGKRYSSSMSPMKSPMPGRESASARQIPSCCLPALLLASPESVRGTGAVGPSAIDPAARPAARKSLGGGFWHRRVAR